MAVLPNALTAAPVAASSRLNSWRRAISILGACAVALFALGSSAARADEWPAEKPVNLDAIAFGSKTFMAAHYAGYAGTQKGVTRALYEVAFLNAYFRDHPDASARSALLQLKLVNDWLAAAHVDPELPLGSYAESVGNVLKELADTPLGKAASVAAGQVVKHLWSHGVEAQEQAAREGQALDSVVALLDGPGAVAQPLWQAEEILGEARSRRDSSEYTKAYNAQIGSQIGISLHDSAEEILDKMPVLKAITGIEELKDGQGGLRTTLGRIEKLFGTELSKLQDEMRGVDGKLVGITKRLENLESDQKDLIELARDEVRRREIAEREAALARQAQQRIDAANAAIFLFSTFAGTVDAQTGKQMQALGTAAVQIVTSLNKWTEAIAGLGATQALTSLSTVIMTGNVVGAVMTLLPVMMDTGPSADELILREIGALREQIADLERDMHERFDRVDRALNLIYARLGNGLNKINLATGRIEGGVKALQDHLVRVQADVHRLEAGMYALVRDQEQRSLILEADRALRLKQRSGGKETMSLAAYLHHESFFRLWGTMFANDRIAIGPPPAERRYADAEILRELRSQPLEASAGYLSRLAEVWNSRPFVRSEPGSYRQWSLAAAAYSELAQEWPEHARTVPAGYPEDLYQRGKELHADLERIANVGTPSEPKANRALFRTFLDKHRRLEDNLLAQIEAVEREGYVPGMTIDPFGGRGQEVSFAALQPEEGEVGDPWPGERLCGSVDVPMLTENGVRGVLPHHTIVAQRLGLGRLRICSRDHRWVDRATVYLPKLTQEWATLEFDIVAQYQESGSTTWQDLRSFVGRGNRQIVCTTKTYEEDPPGTGDCHEAETRFMVEWRHGSLRKSFEDNGKETWRDQGLIDRIGTAVDNRLLELQKGVYERVRERFSSGALRHAADALGGAQAALTDLLALGLPRALLDDELLHALVYGDQRLLDHQLPEQFYAEAVDPARASPWDWLDLKPYLSAPGKNVRDRLAEIGKQRRELVEERLEEAFKRLERGEPQVENVLDGGLGRLASMLLALKPKDAPVELPPMVDAEPRIIGEVRIGQTITADDGAWTSNTPVTFARRWMRCRAVGTNCQAIPDANGSSYEISADDAGHTLRIEVTATNSVGSSTATSALTAPLPSAPVNVARPQIVGLPTVGGTVDALEGEWKGTVTEWRYQWLRCSWGGCDDIPGATESRYEVGKADAGWALAVRVTALNEGAPASATSEATAPVPHPGATPPEP